MRRIRDSNCRDDGETIELSPFNFPLEYTDKLPDKDNEAKGFKKTKFKRDVTLLEQKALEVAERKNSTTEPEKQPSQEENTDEKAEMKADEKPAEASGWGDVGEQEDDGGWNNIPAPPKEEKPAETGWEDFADNQKNEESKVEEESSVITQPDDTINKIVEKDLKTSLLSLVEETRKEGEEDEKKQEPSEKKVEEVKKKIEESNGDTQKKVEENNEDSKKKPEDERTLKMIKLRKLV